MAHAPGSHLQGGKEADAPAPVAAQLAAWFLGSSGRWDGARSRLGSEGQIRLFDSGGPRSFWIFLFYSCFLYAVNPPKGDLGVPEGVEPPILSPPLSYQPPSVFPPLCLRETRVSSPPLPLSPGAWA